MKVVITGGAGFLGQVLARNLLALGELTGVSGATEPIAEIVLFDRVVPPKLLAGLDGRVELLTGDIAGAAQLRSVVDRDDISVFHLASMVSAECEIDFDAALAVNLDGCRSVLEACRARGSRPRRGVLEQRGGLRGAGAVRGGYRLDQAHARDHIWHDQSYLRAARE